MAASFNLAPNPKWYFVDLTGLPLGGGYMATQSNLNPGIAKLVYQDIGGMFPWPYDPIPNTSLLGIKLDANGTQGPFYFEYDPTVPNDTYFLEVFDTNGILQWTVENFFPPNSGGGGSVTTAINLQNLVANNIFYRNIGSTPSPLNLTYTNLAMGANAGLSLTPSLFGPDINFVKNSIASTDQIQFLNFLPGVTPFNPNVTPIQYMNYTSNAVVGETYKILQIPITQGVQNLNNTTLTFTMWGQTIGGGANNLTAQLVQFFGDGSAPSSPVSVPIGVITLSTSWSKSIFTFSVPSIAGKTVGECGNDGLFLQILYPINSVVNINIALPSIYLGTIAPTLDYESYDGVDSVINSARTGDTRATYGFYPQTGWLQMDDGTIGASGSMASNRSNNDTFPLYNLLWNSTNRILVPVIGGAGVSAIADFLALKPIFLPKVLNRVQGATLPQQLFNFTANFLTNILTITSGSISKINQGDPVSLETTGTLPPPLVTGGPLAAVVYYIIVLSSTTFQLASTYANAIAAIPIVITGNGTGINSFNRPALPLAYYDGERTEILTIDQLTPHSHGATSTATTNVDVLGPSGNPFGNILDTTDDHLASNGDYATTFVSTSIASTGGGQPFSTVQPESFSNMFIKL